MSHAGEHTYLAGEVEASVSTSEENRNKTREILQKTEKICRNLEASGYEEKAAKIRKECEDVRLATFGSLKEENFTTKSLLGDLRNSLQQEFHKQPQNLRDGEIINSEMSIIENEYSQLEKANTLEAENEFAEMFPQYENYSPSEAKAELEHISQIYTTLPDGTRTEKALSFVRNSLTLETAEIKSTTTANLAQEVLIDKAYGNGTAQRGFSGENLVGFATDEGGNYIISVSEFEQKLQNGADINPKIFASYVNYIENKCGGNNETFKSEVSKYFGARKDKIDTFLNSSNDEIVQKAKAKLIQVGVFSEGQGLIDWFGNMLKDTWNRKFEGFSQKISQKNTPIEEICKNYEEIQTSYHELEKNRPQEASQIPHPTRIISENTQSLVECTETQDISSAPDSEVKDIIVTQRQEILSQEAHDMSTDIEENILPLFQEAPGIQNFLKEYLHSGKSFRLEDIVQELEREIQTHNKNNPENTLFTDAGEIVGILKVIQGGRMLNIQASLTKNQQELQKLAQQAAEIATEIKKQKEEREGIKKRIDEITSQQQPDVNSTAELQRLKAQLESVGVVIHDSEEKLTQIETEILAVNQSTFQARSNMSQEGLNARILEEIQRDTTITGTPGFSDEKSAGTKQIDPLEQIRASYQRLQKSDHIIDQQEQVEKEIQEAERHAANITKMLESGDYVGIEEASEEIARIYESRDWKQIAQTARKNYTDFTKSQEGKNDVQKKNIPKEIDIGDTQSPSGTVELGETGAEIHTHSGEIIPISKQEAEMVEKNPEALTNMIHFYDFFKELNLEGVWTYRENLVIAMDSVNINIYDDSLDSGELLLFGNEFIKIINSFLKNEGDAELHENHQTIFSLKAELREFSESGNFLAEDKSFNNLGEDKFTALMRKYGIIGGVLFQTNELKKSLRENYIKAA